MAGDIQRKKNFFRYTIEEALSLSASLHFRTEVGFGGSPDENGETTLDSLIMDGNTMDVGAVGCLRNINNAISVARKVLENTEHTLLVGDLAVEFALQMGFKKQSLQTKNTTNMWEKWKNNNCQPNFWKNVVPDPSKSCGPYKPIVKDTQIENMENVVPSDSHDTIGMIAMDTKGNIAAGVSTNGLDYKIPGRVGDSPIPGAGAYADSEIGAAAETGKGDIMMRFLPSFFTVEQMRHGATPQQAATAAIKRIAKYYPKYYGAIIAFHKNGSYGVACHGNITFPKGFPYYVADVNLGKATLNYEACIDNANYKPIGI